MSSKKATPIENASQIIERFGGIRPMASKLDVAVTTVQGWKKRDTIPANRFKTITQAARDHEIDLTGILSTPPVNSAEKPVNKKNVTSPKNDNKTIDEKNTKEETNHHNASIIASLLHDDLLQTIAAAERRATMKANTTTILLILLTIVGIGAIIWPKLNTPTDQSAAIAQLEKQNLQMAAEMEKMKTDMKSMKDRQGFFGQIIPDDLSERLSSIGQKADQARENVANAVAEARTIADEIANAQTEAINARIKALEEELNALGNTPLMNALTQRYDALSKTAAGQKMMENTSAQLLTIIARENPSSEAELETAINQARQNDIDLNQSFENVETEDLKAAALLLTMTQLRSSLNRDSAAFDGDLALLKSLIGDDNPALMQSIDRLSPHAASGILTPAGLTEEFKTITGDVVVASLKGEDVSFTERAKARLNTLFQVEKEGELITGTETQATLNAAEAALEQGDVKSAIATLQTLDGDAAKILTPWIEKAEGTYLAEDLKETLGKVLSPRSTLIQDPESGLTVYTQ